MGCVSKIVKCLRTSRQVFRPKIKCAQVRTTVNLSYKVVGDHDMTTDPHSPPVFLLHGLFGSKRDWIGIGKTILTLTKRVVVTVDLRNHGDSPHDSNNQYEKLAEDVLQLFKKLSVTRVSLVGHGLGGMTAMCIALLAPQTVCGVLVVDMSPIKFPQEIIEYYYQILIAMKEIDFSEFAKIRTAKKAVRKKLRKVISHKDEATMRLVLANVDIQRSSRSLGWTCNVDAFIKNFRHMIKLPKSLRNSNYTGPVLFIGGQFSDYIDPDDLPSIREKFLQAVIVYVPGTGHFVHLDDPKTFLEFTISFLRTNKLDKI